MMPNQRTTGCCIVGGGPAGMMLGYLLARAGVHIVVLEKHADGDRTVLRPLWQSGKRPD